jgi:aspartate/methionine/tyrosine aminotransferase
MFAPTRYLQWARRFYGQVRFDLATSGMPDVDAETLRVLRAREDAVPDEPAAAWAILCAKIAAYNDVTRDQVLPALGTTHALWLACAALLSPGDDVLVEAPAYEPLIRIPEGAGARVLPFRRAALAGFALEPESIARAMTPRTRLGVVTNLHNPTGVRAGDDALRAAARVAAAGGATLLVDEVYAPFDALVDESHGRAVFTNSARKLAPNVVTVSSLTKCYGLGPERVGWLLGPPDVIGRATDALVASAGLLPRSHSRMAVGAFSELPSLASRSRRLLAGKRERVGAWVAARGLRWSAPTEGLFGLVTVPGGVDLTARIEAAVREHDVLVAPGAFFGVPDAFRLAWSLPVEHLDQGLERLAQALGV